MGRSMEEKTLFEGLYRPQPLLIVISGTSGVGKDAVLCGLKELGLNLHFVVTATSRPPRPLEVPGVDYFFYTREDFERRIANNEFIEYTMVYSDWKGIPRSQVDDALRSGKDVVLRVDVQGAMKLRKLYPEAVLIFLIPESVDEWYNRLRSRNTDSPDELALRLKTAHKEVKQIGEFDYVVLNAHDLLEKAVDDIIQIINVEHHKVHHRKALNDATPE
ncbi:MAG TPA: guanylate kinase [Anaerolineaceae bacterium]|nr:guanylate kinase [Anaerolineaceae bacterium]